MSPFNIGLSALLVGTRMMDVAADNIANANTPGYHVKEMSVAPVSGPLVNGVRIGLGVSIDDVFRIRDELVERALLSHTPVEGLYSEQADALAQLEMLFSEPTTNGLDAQTGEFFDALTELSVQPSDPVLREQVVQKASALCDTFNQIDQGFGAMSDSLFGAATTMVDDINDLTARIADLNTRVLAATSIGTSAPDLEDLRDQLVAELSEYVNLTVHDEGSGLISISSLGTLLVSGPDRTELEIQEEDGILTVTRPGGVGIPVQIVSGRLAGLLNVANDLLPGYQQDLDDLADSLRRAVNLVHTTALPSYGRFSSLEGSNTFLTSQPFYDTGYGVAEGTTETLYINVEEEATGEVTRYQITVDTTVDADQFLIDLRDAINDAVSGVDHVTAGIGEFKFNLTADTGYRFGFATPYDPNPAQTGDITAASPTTPTILDAYTGETDMQYDVSFLNGGEIGTDEITIQIDVREPSGPVLRTLTRTIGSDYSIGDSITIEDGLKLSLSAGSVNAGDSFTFVANTTNDSAGVLDALGLNTFFSGQGAGGIHVDERLAEDSSHLAGSIRAVAGDNHRFLDMAALSEAKVADGGTSTLAEFYRSFLSDLAISRTSSETHLANQQQILLEAQNRRDSVSGVSVDEEMIDIIQARALYQGGMQYIRALSDLLGDLATMI